MAAGELFVRQKILGNHKKDMRMDRYYHGWKRTSYICFFLLLGLVIIQGCSYRLIAAYDEKTEEAIFASAKEVDQFYGRLLEAKEEERLYSKYSEEYVRIEAQLNSLVLRNKVRGLNDDSTDISERILRLWRRYKDKHQEKDTYKTGVAKLDRKRFERMFSYAVRAEGAKKPADNEE
jgi:hypothetical protein